MFDMRNKICTVVAVAAVTTLVAVSTPMNAAQGEPDFPIALHGTAPGEVEEVRISAFPVADSRKPELLEELFIEDFTMAASGATWSVYVDPAAIPPEYVYENGVVDFNVYLSNATESWLTSASARMVVDPVEHSTDWTDPLETAPEVSPSMASRHPHRALAMETEVEDDGVTTDGGTEIDQVPVGGCTSQATDSYRRWSTTIGTTYPVGASEAYMAVNSSDGARYGIGYSASGDAGSFSLSGSKFTQNSWSFTWNPNDNRRSYRLEMEYRLWGSACYPYPATYTWRPHRETGGTGQNLDIDRPNWTRCADVSNGTWVRDRVDGDAYSYGAAVKAAGYLGVDLSISREYTTSQKVVYLIRGSSPKKMCGNNGDWPSLAGKMMEKFR